MQKRTKIRSESCDTRKRGRGMSEGALCYTREDVKKHQVLVRSAQRELRLCYSVVKWRVEVWCFDEVRAVW